jgi:hypothetical protein
LTTKNHGNLLDATLFGEVDVAGRLLMNSMCIATLNMTLDTQENTFAGFLADESVRYIITADNKVEHGKVSYIAAPEGFATYDPESLTSSDAKSYVEDLVSGSEVDLDTCVIYDQVECATCAAQGVRQMFFMWCCGSIDQTLFGTGNCCIVGEAQLDGQQDMRRLGKCAG